MRRVVHEGKITCISNYVHNIDAKLQAHAICNPESFVGFEGTGHLIVVQASVRFELPTTIVEVRRYPADVVHPTGRIGAGKIIQHLSDGVEILQVVKADRGAGSGGIVERSEERREGKML